LAQCSGQFFWRVFHPRRKSLHRVSGPDAGGRSSGVKSYVPRTHRTASACCHQHAEYC
jgi:hypothetical protein